MHALNEPTPLQSTVPRSTSEGSVALVNQMPEPSASEDNLAFPNEIAPSHVQGGISGAGLLEVEISQPPVVHDMQAASSSPMKVC